MRRGRMEAFSDGVIAILITIMVLEMKVPHGAELADLRPVVPVFSSYVLSFAYLGIYWNNHHHLLHTVQHVDGRTLWANLHLLFWLSLVPFTTGWLGENGLAPWPVALYGIVLLLAGTAYHVLVRTLIVRHGAESLLARAVGRDLKARLSLVAYAVAIPLAFVLAPVSIALFVAVALLWLAPDRRIERLLEGDPTRDP